MARLRLVVIFILFLVTLTSPHAGVASFPYDPIISREHFNGVDTIIVHASFGPHARTLLDLNVSPTNTLPSRPIDWVTDAVRQVLAGAPHVLVGSGDGGIYQLPASALKRTSAIHLWFHISVRQENVEGRLVTVASLTVQFRKGDSYPNDINFSPVIATYPFPVSDIHKQLEISVRDGVRYLTDYLPYYFCKPTEEQAACKEFDQFPLYRELLPSAVIPEVK